MENAVCAAHSFSSLLFLPFFSLLISRVATFTNSPLYLSFFSFHVAMHTKVSSYLLNLDNFQHLSFPIFIIIMLSLFDECFCEVKIYVNLSRLN